MGQALDDTTSPMGYDTSTRFFDIFTTDTNLAGSQDITLEAYLTDYSSIKTQTPETTTLLIIDPCADAISLTPSIMVA